MFELYFCRKIFYPNSIFAEKCNSENKIQENISSKKYLSKIILHEKIQSEKY